jgi:hypothetical protein
MFRLISASRFFAAVAVAIALDSTGALATTVEVVQPQVFVNRGDGYKPETKTSGVSAGHIVMAAPNGSAKIVYDDGCVVEVQPGAVVSVYETSPCQAQTGAVDTSSQVAAGSGSRRGYILAGVVVAGVVGGVFALTSGGDDDGDNAQTALNNDDDQGSSP